MAIDRTESDYNSILQMSYDDWSRLSRAERDAHVDTLVTGLTDEQQAELLMDLGEEINDDGDLRQQRIEDVIVQIRERIRLARRANNQSSVDTGLALIAELNADLDAWEENPLSMQEATREALERYGESHIVSEDGSAVEISTSDYDNPVTEVTLGGRSVAESPFGEEELSINGRLVEAGLLVEERNNRYAIAEGRAQREIDAQIEQWRQEELNLNQRVTFRVEEGQTISLVATEPPTFRITDADGTTHDYILRGSEEGVIFVFTGGITESDFNTIRSTWGALTQKCYWLNSDGTLSDSFHDYLGGSRTKTDPFSKSTDKVGSDHRTSTARPQENDPEFRPEGYNDVRSASGNIAPASTTIVVSPHEMAIV